MPPRRGLGATAHQAPQPVSPRVAIQLSTALTSRRRRRRGRPPRGAAVAARAGAAVPVGRARHRVGGATARSEWPSCWRQYRGTHHQTNPQTASERLEAALHTGAPAQLGHHVAHQAASDGLGLLSALVRRGPPSQLPPRGRAPDVSPHQTHRTRCVWPTAAFGLLQVHNGQWETARWARSQGCSCSDETRATLASHSFHRRPSGRVVTAGVLRQ